jgi:hypothetical protein
LFLCIRNKVRKLKNKKTTRNRGGGIAQWQSVCTVALIPSIKKPKPKYLEVYLTKEVQDFFGAKFTSIM